MPRIVGLIIEFRDGARVELQEYGWSHVPGTPPIEFGTDNHDFLRGKTLGSYNVLAQEVKDG